jgi:hypothetical protein
MLADAQYSVHDDPAGPEREGVLDRGHDRDPMLGGHRPTEMALGRLIQVHRGQRKGGAGAAIVSPPLEDTADQHVGVQAALGARDDGRDRPGLLLPRWLERVLGHRALPDAGAGCRGQGAAGFPSRHRSARC